MCSSDQDMGVECAVVIRIWVWSVCAVVIRIWVWSECAVVIRIWVWSVQ